MGAGNAERLPAASPESPRIGRAGGTLCIVEKAHRENTPCDLLWETLARVRNLSFVAQSDSETGWRGAGSGAVAVQSFAPDVLVFRETGAWRTEGGRELSFRNTYRWTRLAASLRLEHLRFGESAPVFLFDLTAGENGDLVSATPHQCRADLYRARLWHDGGVLHLHWTVCGAHKNERIAYTYF